jgi:hypothetical protein
MEMPPKKSLDFEPGLRLKVGKKKFFRGAEE